MSGRSKTPVLKSVFGIFKIVALSSISAAQEIEQRAVAVLPMLLLLTAVTGFWNFGWRATSEIPSQSG